MRRTLLPVLLLAAACGAPKAQVKPDYDAVKRRADAAHDETAPKVEGRAVETEKGVSKEEKPKSELVASSAKILGTDPEGCTWLEGAATVAVAAQDTRHQARAAALDQARAAAVKDFLGVEVKSRFMDFQQEGLRKESRLTEGILQTTRNGRILKEEVLEEGYRDAEGCPACLYRMKVKACAVPRPAGGDPDFGVELGVSSPRFRAGEEAKLTITATRDAWIYLYNVYDLGLKDQTALVVPNELVLEKRVKAGETWEYPDETARKAGVRLVAELPQPEDEVSAETVRVVASKAALPKSVVSPADGGWLGVLRRLNRSTVEWTEDAEAYTIYKK